MSRTFSKEEIIKIIQQLAARLGHVPSIPELTRNTSLTRRQIRKNFCTYDQALKECALDRHGAGHKLGMDILFRDWAVAVRKLNRVPSVTEYEQLSRFSMGPLKRRFRGWSGVPRGLADYVQERGWMEEYKDVMELIEEHERRHGRAGLSTDDAARITRPKVRADRPVYGPLLRPYPVIHGPTNEAGVLFLFGAMAADLGFAMVHMQTQFPDCEAMRMVGEDRWQKVIIELEYESRNFVKHNHAEHACDIIVCWIHNWPECPLEVIELSKLIGGSGKQAASY
jgi:hypothetical protein